MASIYNSKTRTPNARRFQRDYPLDPNRFASMEREAQGNVTSGLFYETSFGKAVINAETRLVVGQGLRVEPAPEDVGPITQKRRTAFVAQVNKLWRMWCNSPEGDWYGRNTFYQQQQIAFREILSYGDVLSHIVVTVDRNGLPGLKHQLVSGRYVRSAPGTPDTKKQTAGVLFDKDGRESGYLIAETTDDRMDAYRSKAVRKTDSQGRTVYNLVHIGDVTPNQARGISIFSPVKDLIINMTGFIDAYVAKAKAQAVFAIGFTHSETPTSQTALEAIKEASDDEPADEGAGTSESIDFSQTGLSFDMPPGEDVHVVESSTPSLAFRDFIDALSKIGAAGCGIPVEVMFSAYNSNYSASRATIKDAEAGLSILREEFARQFCQPVYETFVDECVACGLVKAPGYYDDPLVRKAWLATTWTGPTVTDIDPLKEVNAMITAHSAGLISKERICKTLFGTDYAEVVEIIKHEKDMEKALGLSFPADGGAEAEDTEGEEDDGE